MIPAELGASPPAPRVALAATHRLVGDSVEVALSAAGLAVRRVPFGRPGRTGDVIVLIGDTSDPGLTSARLALTGSGRPWIVLTETPRGPEWGLLLESGAWKVLGARTSLAALVARVAAAGSGEAPCRTSADLEMIAAHLERREAQADARDRMALLSPRQIEVLSHLHRGSSPRAIAERTDMTENAVRSLRRGLLRRLGVGSQLAAVALYELGRPQSPPLRGSPTVVSTSRDRGLEEASPHGGGPHSLARATHPPP